MNAISESQLTAPTKFENLLMCVFPSRTKFLMSTKSHNGNTVIGLV